MSSLTGFSAKLEARRKAAREAKEAKTKEESAPKTGEENKDEST